MFSLFTKKDPKINTPYCKTFLGEQQFQNYLQLKQQIDRDLILKLQIILFNPGAEDDIVNPILTLDAITNLNNKKQITMYFVDLKDLTIFIENNIKKLIPNAKIKKTKTKNQTKLTFKFKNATITIVSIVDDVFNTIKKMGKWDIYFERAFEIIREQNNEFNEQVQTKTNHLIISDTNFIKEKTTNTNWEKIQNLPTQIGFYKEFSIYKRNE